MSTDSTILKCSNLSKWDSQTTMKFLQLYNEHECLWNRFNKYYKDKQMRTSALINIRDRMNLPNFDIPLICSKIRILRTTYTEERKKIQKRYDLGGQYTTQLEWFSFADSFLKNVVQYRKMLPSGKKIIPAKSRKTIIEKHGDNRRKILLVEKNQLKKSINPNSDIQNKNETTSDVQNESANNDSNSETNSNGDNQNNTNNNQNTDDIDDKDDSDCLKIDENDDVSVLGIKNELYDEWPPIIPILCSTISTADTSATSSTNLTNIPSNELNHNLKDISNNLTASNDTTTSYPFNLELKDSSNQNGCNYQYSTDLSSTKPPQLNSQKDGNPRNSLDTLKSNCFHLNINCKGESHRNGSSNSTGGGSGGSNNNYKNNEEREEFNIFGKSVAGQLIRLPLDKAYELELKIQYLLTNAKLEAMGRDPINMFD